MEESGVREKGDEALKDNDGCKICLRMLQSAEASYPLCLKGN